MAKEEESLFAIDDLDLDLGCSEEHGEANKTSDVTEAEPLQVRRPCKLTLWI